MTKTKLSCFHKPGPRRRGEEIQGRVVVGRKQSGIGEGRMLAGRNRLQRGGRGVGKDE